MDSLADFARRNNASIDAAISGLQKLTISSSGRGKENAGSKDSLLAVQQCLKAAQKRLAQPGEDVQQLTTLCQSCLRLLEQQTGAVRTTQLHTAAYTTIRLMVSAKAFAPALDEAMRLHRSMSKEYKLPSAEDTSNAAELATDVLNLAVGAILTLALCWAEGAAKSTEQLKYVLAAAENAQSWFSLLPPQDAAKHSQTLFKSLYRGSAKLLEAKQWENLEAACTTMVSAGGQTAVPLALSAAAKLAPHIPDPSGVHMLSSVLQNPFIISNLKAVEESNSSGKSSAAPLEVLFAALGPSNLLRKRVSALISGSSFSEAGLSAVGGHEAALQAAFALDIGARIVAAGCRATSDSTSNATEKAFSSYTHSAAVSLLTAAQLRVACARAGGVVDWTRGNEAAARVLGWQWPIDFSAILLEEPRLGHSSSLGAILSPQELTWLSSSLFNLGIELLTSADSANTAAEGAAACEVMAMATAASLAEWQQYTVSISLDKNGNEETDVSDGGVGSSELPMQLSRNVAKKAVGFVEALSKAGRTTEAIKAAADTLSVALSINPEFDAGALQTIVSSAVKQQALVGLVAVGAPAEEMVKGKPSSKRRTATTTTSRTRSTKSSTSTKSSDSVVVVSLTAAVQAHAGGLSADSVAAVARAELAAWAAELSSGDGLPPSATAQEAASAAAQHLLDAVYPAKTAPLDHARTLLLLHTLKLQPNTSEEGEDACLKRAQRVLQPLVKRHNAAAMALAALAAAQSVLDDAQELVHAAIENQQRAQHAQQAYILANPSEVHADGEENLAGASSSVSRCLSMEEDDEEHTGKNGASSLGEEWQRVVLSAQKAIHQVSKALNHGAHDGDPLEDGRYLTSLAIAARELVVLADLHGVLDQEGEALAEDLLVLWGDESVEISQSLSSLKMLQECILPTGDPSQDASVLEAAANELAKMSGRRDQKLILHRAELSMAAALGHAASGMVVHALHCAGEAHRLLSSVVREGGLGALGKNSGSSSSVGGEESVVGWWRMAAAYCKSLLLVGRLFESAGMAEEAISALKEGHKMAEAMGCSLLGAAFSSQLAMLLTNAGQIQAATTAVDTAQALLDALPELSLSSVAAQWTQSYVASAQARLYLVAGSSTQAVLCSHAALEACQAALDAAAAPGDSVSAAALSTHLESARAMAYLTRVECLRAENRDPSEIAQAAKEALRELNPATCTAFGTAARAGLLLAQDSIGVGPLLRDAELSSARLWGPGQFTAELQGACSASSMDTSYSDEESSALRWAGSATLWQAFLTSRGAPHVHRLAAGKLAPACSAAGFSHLAALLHHLGAGTTLQVQHQLVQHARARNAQRRQRAGSDDVDTAAMAAAEALKTLESGLDWDSIGLICGYENQEKAVEEKPKLVKRASRRGATTKAKAASIPAADVEENSPSSSATTAQIYAVLASLEAQAENTLNKWLHALPQGTIVTTVGSRQLSVIPTTRDSSECSTRDIQRDICHVDCLVVSRIAAGGAPPLILDIPIKPYGAGGPSVHPIRALALQPSSDEPGSKENTSTSCSGSGVPTNKAVQSAVQEMARILERSTHSMKEMPTDTRDQQREWWHTRVELDDSLAALMQHLGTEWLGPWRCLLIGAPEEPIAAMELRDRAASATQQLVDVLGADEAPHAVRELVAVVLHSMGSMSSGELKQAASTLCTSLLAASGTIMGRTSSSATGSITPTMVKKAVTILEQAGNANLASNKSDAATESSATASMAVPAPGPVLHRKVTFCEDAVAEASPAPTLRRVATTFAAAENDSFAEGVGGSNLCSQFDALALNGGAEKVPAATPGILPARTPGAATIRAKKHRSRLALMQTATPAPKSTRKPSRPAAILDETVTSTRFAATAPRAPRPLATPAAAGTVPARSRPAPPTLSGPPGTPVVVIFDQDLQFLPWESAPGLTSQRLYRLPALPCAAAAAAATAAGRGGRSHGSPSVDLSSVYYAINPSGDLQSTQDTFEAWFKGLRGWSGRAGCSPPSSELASALQSRELFVYCGHGGGEQYIPPARLRGLPRCAASLLMGCSSGRLRDQGGYYEPSGIVLAYLLAGCPAAVANLWDVTDRDIDRFAQDVLTRWLSGQEGGGRDVSAAVAAARGACKLPSLIGAAPVCYGVPTSVAAPLSSRK